ncbi:hypothetical protein BKA67DRAFT_538055 [Truncatella angustata]|uniref:Uncharacterized protein n=1 Tax=Truncatella angustata TaxID=152316 RepID=A0A9P8ZVQ1_9PEZI|nr:uncharacterized protein BKA67DRAFT_538055 [Truncatella angustata]KAH6652230.1 hypothetical protein BKA67DRAFT_538055 [Truncatella angustata]
MAPQPHHSHRGGGRGSFQGSNNNQNNGFNYPGDWSPKGSPHPTSTGGRGGYKGKNFDPGHHKRFSSQQGLVPDGGNTPQPFVNRDGNGANSGGSYKGRNFDPDYQNRVKSQHASHHSGNHGQATAGNHPFQLSPDQPSGPRNRSNKKRSRRDRQNLGGRQDPYFHRKRRLDQSADTWMCECQTPPTECHEALMREYLTMGNENRQVLAQHEHATEVMKCTIEHFLQSNPHLRQSMEECYKNVEQQIIQQEFEQLQDLLPDVPEPQVPVADMFSHD